MKYNYVYENYNLYGKYMIFLSNRKEQHSDTLGCLQITGLWLTFKLRLPIKAGFQISIIMYQVA